jgi:uncharacterized membrane protein YkoI
MLEQAMQRRHRIISIVLAAALAGTATLSLFPAQADEGPAVARRLSEAGVILPLEKIVAAARKIKPGEVLESELERKGKDYVYEIEILDVRGQVWEVKLDAKSARLIKLESED